MLKISRICKVLMVLSIMVCVGCASSPASKFYQLNSLQPENPMPEKSPDARSSVVAVGPVRIPDYLNRPQIVTRSGDNEIRIAEFHRWAGSLEQDIVRVLTENLSAQLPKEEYFVAPWTSVSRMAHQYRVEVNIIRFEGVRGKSVQMKAQWALFDKSGVLDRQESDIVATLSDSSYESFVAALSKTLFDLSGGIARSISEKNTSR